MWFPTDAFWSAAVLHSLNAMATVTHFRFNPVRQTNGTMAWNLPGMGDRDNYWGFSVRPFQSNNTTVLQSVSANTGNGIEFVSTDVVVTCVSAPDVNGGLIRLAAVRVTP